MILLSEFNSESQKNRSLRASIDWDRCEMVFSVTASDGRVGWDAAQEFDNLKEAKEAYDNWCGIYGQRGGGA